MIFISRVISIIIQKNTLCTSKIRVIYFCPNCVSVPSENVIFLFIFIYLFIYLLGGGEGDCPLLPPSSYAYGEGKLLKGKKSLRIFRRLCFHAIPPVKLKIILASSILPMLTIKDGRRVSKHTESSKS